MARARKNGKRVSMILNQDIIKRLDDFSKKSGLTKTAIVENALNLYMNKKEKIIKELTE